MKKTVGTLCAGDLIYEPRVDEIIQQKVTQIIKDNQGTRIDAPNYNSRIRDCDYCSEIATKVTYDNRRYTFYVRLEDAQVKQKEMQTVRLKELQQKVVKAIEELNVFTNKYFTDETIH